jgi:hypothetical protein
MCFWLLLLKKTVSMWYMWYKWRCLSMWYWWKALVSVMRTSFSSDAQDQREFYRKYEHSIFWDDEATQHVETRNYIRGMEVWGMSVLYLSVLMYCIYLGEVRVIRVLELKGMGSRGPWIDSRMNGWWICENTISMEGADDERALVCVVWMRIVNTKSKSKGF